jgi:hypothetical protein
MDGGVVIALFLAAVFACGHGLLAVYSQLLEVVLTRCRVTTAFDEVNAQSRQSFLIFKQLVQEPMGEKEAQSERVLPSWDYRDLRSVALSVSTEASSIGRRFMFIALLCKGVGTSAVIVLVDFILCTLYAPNALFAYDVAVPVLGQAALLLIAAYAFIKEGEVFYSRAMTTPFSVAVAEMKYKGVQRVSL